MENYNLDQGIKSVTTDPSDGTVVTIENLDRMAMPVIIGYETKKGVKGILNLPVEIWNNTGTFKVKLPVKEGIKTVTIDPDRVFPDLNYGNNKWSN